MPSPARVGAPMPIAATVPTAAVAAPLPPGWREYTDPTHNRAYYVNESTNETGVLRLFALVVGDVGGTCSLAQTRGERYAASRCRTAATYACCNTCVRLYVVGV
jgi:hypothetical protein